jgi:ankyrin repeat protein
VNDLGWTAMLEAIVLGDGSDDHVETIRLLLEAGADPSIADGNGALPRELAEQAGYDEIVALIDAAS